ncbi:MAG: hypothetical protein ACE144_15150 [Thermodesulfobacteriota bacterium]
MEFKDRWIIMVLLGLLIFSLVATQIRREDSTDETAQTGRYDFAGAYGEEHPHSILLPSFAVKTAVLSWRDRYFTLFDLLEAILDFGLSRENPQAFVGGIEKDSQNSGR